ncbi:hypothetical protein Tco_0520360 [Tanacetum coccineum]
MSRKFYNSIMKDKIDYEGKNVVKTFMNVPVFVGNFCVVTNFAVMENMDIYRDKDMGDVIIGEHLQCLHLHFADPVIKQLAIQLCGQYGFVILPESSWIKPPDRRPCPVISRFILSNESLKRQFPVKVSDHLMLANIIALQSVLWYRTSQSKQNDQSESISY